MRKLIWVVAGDTGGWNATYPVVRLAADAGFHIKTFFVGACAKQAEAGILKTDPRFEVVPMWVAEECDLVVVGMSQSVEGLQAATQAALTAKAPVVAIQDYYGSATTWLKAMQEHGTLGNIRSLGVIDEAAAKDIQEKVPAFTALAITGGPHFDQVMAKKQTWAADRAALRSQLGVADGEVLFLVVGQPDGTAEIVAMLDGALQLMQPAVPARVLISMHPRASALNQTAVAAYLQQGTLSLVNPLPIASDDLLPAADFVLAGYSTTNHFAVLYGMPGVMYVRTPILQADLERDTGFDRPMEAQAGAAWYVTTPAEITHVITEVQAGDGSAELAAIKQQQAAMGKYNDGQATQRVWAQWSRYLLPSHSA